ncbi:MAG: hypothetical protein Q4G27_00650 [Flavobacteriaceae bacterium]|nr:hypothetical protein [Flavobacteriaceae bacterium]
MNTEIILSSVIATATIVYTIVTIFQLIESRKVRLQKSTPNIIAFLKSAENHIAMELHIKNFGEGVAKDVEVNFIKDFRRFNNDEQYFSSVGIAQNGLNYFPPNHFFKYYVGSMVTLYEENENEKIVVKISYKSLDNRYFSNIFELPFNQIFGQNYSSPPETYMGQIPYYLKEINSQLKKMNVYSENQLRNKN